MENADEDLFQDNLASHPFSFKKKKPNSPGREPKPLITVAALYYQTANPIRHCRSHWWLQIIFACCVCCFSYAICWPGSRRALLAAARGAYIVYLLAADGLWDCPKISYCVA